MVPGAEDLVPFTEANWGEITRQYKVSTYNLKDKSWDFIIKQATAFSGGGRGKSSIDSETGERGQFMDLSDGERGQFLDLSDGECKLYFTM